MKSTILINKKNPWKDQYSKYFNLMETYDIYGNLVKIEENTYSSYLKLKKYLEEKDILIGITSCYRSVLDQKMLREELLKERGEEYVSKYVAFDTESEHSTGLAIDIAVKIGDTYLDEGEDFYTLMEEVHPILKDFGFILRYPKDKEKITGYSYEAWHIRYVGKIPASIIFEKNYTLEEYLEQFGGILYINKEKNRTSFDVVHEISKLYGIKRVGHTGTLDPMAEGVLIVCIGQACKIVELLTSKEKEYIASVKLGVLTDTLDITGNILKEEKIPKNLDIVGGLEFFHKTYLQEVPIYSSVKVNGKKLYEYARSGKSVELPKKMVTIYEISLLEQNEDSFTFKTLVSKGCYIRSLIRDILEYLNTIGVMDGLVRTRQGVVSLSDTNTLEEVCNGEGILHSMEEVLDYPVIKVSKELEFQIKNGVSIPDTWNICDKVIFKNYENQLLGIYEKYENVLKTWKNFR